ncbi:MAG: tetratricopeptide repeat protein, partial [Polyangiaceae bacterium]|nr:tetratricopeptide repeat protein [Polyangiaceae bacterium]
NLADCQSSEQIAELILCARKTSQEADMSFGAADKSTAEALHLFTRAEELLTAVLASKSEGRANDLEKQKRVMRDYLSFEIARHCLAQGSVEGVGKRLDDLIPHYPQDPEIWGAQGVLLVAQGRISEALSPLARAVQLAPDSAERRRAYGTVLLLQGNLESAIAQYRAALARQADLRTQGDLGSALIIAGRFEEGLAYLRAVIIQEPEHPVYLSNYAYGLLQAGELDQAEKVLRKGLVRYPDSVHFQLNYVLLLAQRSECAQAWSLLQPLRATHRQDPRVDGLYSDLLELCGKPS